MPSMTKRVNVTTIIPVRTLTPPLHGTYKNIIMSTGDILKCISRRAIVDEILPGGTTIRLTMGNYYSDNGAGLDALEQEERSRKAESNKTFKSEEKEIKVPDVPIVEDILDSDTENLVVETDADSAKASVNPEVVKTNTKEDAKADKIESAAEEAEENIIKNELNNTDGGTIEKKTTSKKKSKKSSSTKKNTDSTKETE